MVIFKFRNLKTGQAMPLPPGDFTIGRSDQAYVHVEDPSVSRRHARLFNTGEGLFIEDAGSANGTAMQGALVVGRKQLNIGDVVHIGSVPYRVDPEVGGDLNLPTVAPMAGRRSINRDYMRRDTERLSVELIDKAVEALTTDEDDALAVAADEAESEELKTIDERKPDAPVPGPSVKGGWFHGTHVKPVARPIRNPVPDPATEPKPEPATKFGLRGFLGKSKEAKELVGSSQPIAKPLTPPTIALEVNNPSERALNAICDLIEERALTGGVKISGQYDLGRLQALKSIRKIGILVEQDCIILL